MIYPCSSYSVLFFQKKFFHLLDFSKTSAKLYPKKKIKTKCYDINHLHK